MAHRGSRKEDLHAAMIAEAITVRADAILHSFRAEIKGLPEVIKQQASAKVSGVKWEHYITALARRAIAGESVLALTNEFNRTYVFPFREKKAKPKH